MHPMIGYLGLVLVIAVHALEEYMIIGHLNL